MLLHLTRRAPWPSTKQVFGTLKRLYLEAKEDDILGLAGELAFRFFLALFPFFIFLAALGGFITQLDAVIGTHSAGLLSFGVIGSIVAASGGVGTLMKGANRAYNVRESRKLWT